MQFEFAMPLNATDNGVDQDESALNATHIAGTIDNVSYITDCLHAAPCGGVDQGGPQGGLTETRVACLPKNPQSVSPSHVAWELVMWKLDGRSLAGCAVVCKSWHETAQDCQRWQLLIHTDLYVPTDSSGNLLLYGGEVATKMAHDGFYFSADNFAERDPLSSQSPQWVSRLVSAGQLRITRTVRGSGWSPRQFLDDDDDDDDDDDVSRAIPSFDVTSPSLDYKAVYVCLYRHGWWFGRGIEVRDYCGKWFKARVVGLDYHSHTLGGRSPSAIAADHPIRQLTPVPPGGCRLLVHFEGWTEKWDEFLVLPTEASRFRNLIRGDTGRRVNDPSCFIGEVAGLHLCDVGAAAAAARDDGGVGETQHVAVVGVWFPKESCSFPCTSAPIPTPTLATAPHTATTAATGATISRDWHKGWCLLLRDAMGAFQWLDLSDLTQRRRLLEYIRPYPLACTCEVCREALLGPPLPAPPLQPPPGLAI